MTEKNTYKQNYRLLNYLIFVLIIIQKVRLKQDYLFKNKFMFIKVTLIMSSKLNE